MGQNEFVESVVEIMLSWMRWLTNWFWGLSNTDFTSGFLNWFAEHWINLALFLIIAFCVVDWLVWMVRWRPYWLWLHKKQIVYEDAGARKRRRRPPVEEETPKFNGIRSHDYAGPRSHLAEANEDYEDPFADINEAEEDDEYEPDPFKAPETPSYHPIRLVGERMKRRNYAAYQSGLPSPGEWIGHREQESEADSQRPDDSDHSGTHSRA